MTKQTLSDKGTPSILIEELSPEKAKKLLEKNTGNFRKIDHKRVRSYAEDMKSKNWDLTGDTIKITNGMIIDGQHRLLAIVHSGVPIITAVAYDVAVSAVNVDRGKPRSISQWLRHVGFSNASTCAAAAKLCVMHDLGMWSGGVMQIDDFKHGDIINYAIANKEELESAAKISASAASLMPKSVGCAIIHIGSGRIMAPMGNEVVEWFWNGLIRGSDLQQNDPPLSLRERLFKNKTSTTGKFSTSYTRWLVTLAWNRAAVGSPISPKQLSFRLSGPSKQNPPELIVVAE